MNSLVHALLVRAGACAFYTDPRTGMVAVIPFAASGTGGPTAPSSATPPITRPLPEPAGSILDLWASPRSELWIG